MRAAQRLILLVICGFLLSCSDDNNEACSVEQQNRFVHELLKEFYLWYQDVPQTIDYSAFPSPEATLAFLRNEELDRFSNITDTEAFNNLFSAGQFTGYGFSFTVQNDNTLWIRFVYSDSPANRAGLQRGDEVLTINNQDVADLITSNSLNSAFGPAEIGYPLEMLVRKANSSVVSMSMQKDIVNINTVLHSSIINTAQGVTGYLVFNSFLSTSNAELQQVFSEFSTASIERLVLDLRYNGGGSVPVANNLASYMNRVADHSQLFLSLVYNDKHQSSNQDYYLLPMIEALDLQQLTIITSEATCSASEMVINGLQPYPVEVKTVGGTTCGKPVGMNPYNFCSKTILPVTFQGLNKDGIGDYFDGIAADCPAADDVDFDFGDSNEPMLREALHLMNNGQCSVQPRGISRQPSAPLFPPSSLRAIIGAY